MSPPSQAESQRILSQILSDKRKKDPIGLLRAQRAGTLNEYLREDLAKRGLAVAGEAKPAGARAPSKAAGAGGTALPSPASSAGSSSTRPHISSSASPGQRHSYKAPRPGGGAGSSEPAASADSADSSPGKQSRGSLASLEPLDALGLQSSPPQQQASTEARGAPGKLSASRFGKFGEKAEAREGGVSSVTAAAPVGVGAGRKSNSPRSGRRWSVGPSSSPSRVPGTSPGQKSETPAQAQENPTRAGQGQPGQDEESVGALAGRFGGALKVGNAAKEKSCVTTSAREAGASAAVPISKRSASGRIAELARNFEK